MKKIIFLLGLITLGYSVSGQSKVNLGVKAGLNFSSLSNLDNSSTKTGLDAGLFVNIDFARFYEMQVETTYSNQGSSFRSGDDLCLGYINLNVANKFYPIPNAGFNLVVGPGINFLVHDDDADITSVDFSIFGGVGYEFPFGLGLEFRYKQGFIDVREDYYDAGEDDYYYDGENILNGAIQLGVSYRFSM